MIAPNPDYDDALTDQERELQRVIQAQMEAMAKAWDMAFKALEYREPKTK